MDNNNSNQENNNKTNNSKDPQQPIIPKQTQPQQQGQPPQPMNQQPWQQPQQQHPQHMPPQQPPQYRGGQGAPQQNPQAQSINQQPWQQPQQQHPQHMPQQQPPQYRAGQGAPQQNPQAQPMNQQPWQQPQQQHPQHMPPQQPPQYRGGQGAPQQNPQAQPMNQQPWQQPQQQHQQHMPPQQPPQNMGGQGAPQQNPQAQPMNYQSWQNPQYMPQQPQQQGFANKTSVAVNKFTKTQKALVVSLMLTVFGVVSMFFFETIPTLSGLSIPVVLVLFYVVAIIFFHDKTKPVPKVAMLLLVPIAILSLSFVWTSTLSAHRVSFIVLILLMAIQLILMSKAGQKTKFSISIFNESLVTTFAPFAYLHTIFVSLFARREKKSKYAKVLIGVLIGLPIMALFIIIFAAADEQFQNLVESIFSKINIVTICFDIVLGIILAIYLTPMFILLYVKRDTPIVESKTIQKNVFDNIVISTMIIMVAVAHIFFIIFQITNLYSEAKPGLTLEASAAHLSFAQLLVSSILVTIINAVAIIFTKRNKNGYISVYMRLSISLLTICSIITSMFGLATMVNHVNTNGLTTLRLMVFIFEIFIISCFVLVIVKMWIRKLNLFVFVFAATIIFTIGYSAIRPYTFVANYNADMYLTAYNNNEVDTNNELVVDLDVAYLKSLGDSAAPALYDVYQNGPEDVSAEAFIALYNLSDDERYYEYEEPWSNYTVDDIEANKIYSELADEFEAYESIEYDFNKDGKIDGDDYYYYLRDYATNGFILFDYNEDGKENEEDFSDYLDDYVEENEGSYDFNEDESVNEEDFEEFSDDYFDDYIYEY